MKKLALLLMAIALNGCHCLSCYYPADLPTDRPREILVDGAVPAAPVEILLDDFGIPHIFGESDDDLAFGLGYMHGRDRTWQLLFIKHVSQGRLTELLGEDYLSSDQFLRLIAYPKERALAALEPRTLSLLEAYATGVNQAARERGRTAEMDLVGVDFGEWEPIDTVSIALFFIDDQSLAFRPEIARRRMMNRLPSDSPILDILLHGTPTGGVPVVDDDASSAEPLGIFAQTSRAQNDPRVLDGSGVRSPKSKRPAPKLDNRVRSVVEKLFEPQGHSNSWSVHGSLTDSGSPVLANDPHLGHQAPGIFYFAHMEHDDYSIVGGTFPGAPAVLIGAGRDIAWGITNAYGDCQDLVVIEPMQGQEDLYQLDGSPMNYGSIVQRYKLGKEEDAAIFEEVWKTTIFGPVIPPGREFLVDEGDILAYQWCAEQYVDRFDASLSMWWELAKSANVAEADVALARFVTPPLSFNMAFTDGTIAYRTAGFFPQRKSDEPIHLPRDGRFRDAGLGDPLPFAQKPQLTNPELGFIVASNQRIVGDESPLLPFVGVEGGQAYRAQRITERLVELLGNKRPSAKEIGDIQQDVTSVEARDAAPILGAHCPSEVDGHPRERVLGFCTAVRNFNGAFERDSLGALPYQLLMTAFVRDTVVTHFGEEVGPDIANRSSTRARVFEELVKVGEGESSALFLEDQVDAFVARAAKLALDDILQFGANPVDWRWGRAHTLTYKNTLAGAPVVGGLFKSADHEEAGCKQCVRAEGPIPVGSGSGLRFVAEMTSPPRYRMVGDLGQVGHFGHRHGEDMYPRWTSGDLIELSLDRASIEGKRTGWLLIK